jgi:nitroreductase
MRLNLSTDDVLTTTRSVRKRLDFDRPVERQLLQECLNLALQAPSGSNRQGWQWVFVDDTDTKRAMRDIYLERWRIYTQMPRPDYDDADVRGQRMDAIVDSAAYLAENIHRAPYLLVPCIEGQPEHAAGAIGAGLWGSLLPAVWSFMLALRERGLGSAWTTLHLIFDGEQRAAELLGIPYDTHRQAGLFPIAYTIGTDFKPAHRLPSEKVIHWNRW